MWRDGILLCCLLALLSGCKQEYLKPGEIAPRLAAYDVHDVPVQLERWKGKVIYLTFWSASCGGCLNEMVTLNTLSKIYADAITVVAVNTDPPQTDIASVLSQWQIEYPVLRDQLGITQERYQVTGTPTAFLIDVNGRVAELHQGARNEPTLRALFQQWATTAAAIRSP